MLRKTFLFIVAIAAALGGMALHEAAAQSANPDPAKWNNSGFIRVFEMNAGKLLSGITRKGGHDNGAFTFTSRNDMKFVNPNSVNVIEATVTLLDASAIGAGFTSSPRASLEGHFYWDGTGTGTSSDQTGHVFATINLALNAATGLTEARYFVIRCLNASCDNENLLVFDTLGSIEFFEPHDLRIEYDGSEFIFTLDGFTPVMFTAPDETRNPPTVPFKTLRTRIMVPQDATASASVLALFDDVSVNDAPYDSFDDKTLPRVSIMPGSGTFVSTQVTDIAILIETDGQTVTDVKLTLDGNDISNLLASFASGTLAAGGESLRRASLPATAIPAGQHVVGVEATFDDATTARGFALWNVLATVEP